MINVTEKAFVNEAWAKGSDEVGNLRLLLGVDLVELGGALLEQALHLPIGLPVRVAELVVQDGAKALARPLVGQRPIRTPLPPVREERIRRLKTGESKMTQTFTQSLPLCFETDLCPARLPR